MHPILQPDQLAVAVHHCTAAVHRSAAAAAALCVHQTVRIVHTAAAGADCKAHVSLQ
jgi:hypothetical protein